MARAPSPTGSCLTKDSVQTAVVSRALKDNEANPVLTNPLDEELYEKVCYVMDKLMAMQLAMVIEDIQNLPISSVDDMKGVINLIFEKASKNENTSDFARLCKFLCSKRISTEKVPQHRIFNKKNAIRSVEYVNVCKLILDKCQEEFKKLTANKSKDESMKERPATHHPEQKMVQSVHVAEEHNETYTKAIGNIRLMGELFKSRVLPSVIMHRFIQKLLDNEDEESLEYLCVLLSTIGPVMEEKKQDLAPYFKRINQICQRKGAVSNRVENMLEDLIDQRHCEWVSIKINRKSRATYQINKEEPQSVRWKEYMMDRNTSKHTMYTWKLIQTSTSEIPNEAMEIEDLYKKVRGVLNKLTPQKFTTLVAQVQSLPIDTKDKLQGVINLVFDKAIDEPGFSVAYALMCKVLSNMQVPADKDENKKDEGQEGVEYVNFRKLIVNRCQQEFEKNSESQLNKEQRLKEIFATKDPEKKKELQLQFEEDSQKLQMKSVGNIIFIGELFKLQMLTTNIMHRCIRQLLNDGDEDSLECLCKLLTTIGRDLETKKQDLGQYFEKMKQVSQKRGEISSRVRFMLQDVIELRQHKWIPRRDDLNPKTIDQINKKLAVEQAMNSGPSSGPRYKNEDRGGDQKKNRGPSEDGWSLAGRPKNYTVDAQRLKPKVIETDNYSLGSRSNYTNWTANSKAADTNKKCASPIVSINSIAALSDMPSEEKRASGLSSRAGSNKIAPSSSAEKERMLAGYKSATEELRPQQSHLQQS